MTDNTYSQKLILVLDNIRSLYNVGAIFRLADGLGISKMELCGITPAPPRAEIHKTALGAEQRVAWEHHASTVECVQGLQKRGVHCFALEVAPDAMSLLDFTPTFPLALVIGHEREGIESDVLKTVDQVVSIPMQGHGHSLNVATAAAIAVWHIIDK